MQTEKNRAPPTKESWERTRYKAAYAALFFARDISGRGPRLLSRRQVNLCKERKTGGNSMKKKGKTGKRLMSLLLTMAMSVSNMAGVLPSLC